MIDRPVRYGVGHSPHEEDGMVFDPPWDPFGTWAELDEIIGQWQQGAGTDLTPKEDD